MLGVRGGGWGREWVDAGGGGGDICGDGGGEDDGWAAGVGGGVAAQGGALEVKYLLKLMSGDMRIGVKQSLVEEAIAVAANADVSTVRNAVMLEADLAGAVKRAFAGTLGEARMRLFHPLGFMLASPVETPEEAVARFGGKAIEGEGDAGSIEAFLEDKYDGMRAQVHCGDAGEPGRVAIYSRNKEDVTESFPELEEAFAKADLGLGSVGGLIFDGEILGWDLSAAGAAVCWGRGLEGSAWGMSGGGRFRWCLWRSI